MDSAKEAAATDFVMPHNRTALVWVKRVNITALLAHQQVIASLARPQDCRGADIQIRAVLFRAVGRLTDKARHIPGIPAQQLLRPLTLARG